MSRVITSSSKCCEIRDEENKFKEHESVNFSYCQRSKVGGRIRQKMSKLK